jgi:hypothetical protein
MEDLARFRPLGAMVACVDCLPLDAGVYAMNRSRRGNGATKAGARARFGFLSLALAALMAWAANAEAAHANRLAILNPPEGAAFVSAVVIAVEADGFNVVPPAEVEAAAAELGLQSFGTRELRALVKRLDLAATVVLEVSRPDARHVAAHIIMRGRRGQVLRGWDWSRSDVETPPPLPPPQPPPPSPRPPPPAPPPSPVAALRAPAPAPRPEPPPHNSPPLLHASIGPRLLFRSLRYDSDPAGLLPDYRTGKPTLGLGLGVRLHPLRGWWRPLGLAVDAELGQQVRTLTDAGLYLSSNSDLHATLAWTFSGARWRGSIEAGAGLQHFSYRPEGAHITHPPPFPDVGYRYLRPGFSGQFSLTPRLSLLAQAHYRAVVSAGNVTSASWFPGATAAGFDAGLSVDVRFRSWLSVALGYDVRRYHLDFSTARTVRESAGAVDLHQALSLHVNLSLGQL